MQEGDLDPGQQRRQALAGRQRRRIVPGVDGNHRRHHRQLGPGLQVQRGGGGEQLLHPGPGLALEVPLHPEQQQDPEQGRQWPAVMGQVPAHRRGQVPCLGVQPLQPLARAGGAQRPVGLLG
ncbi:MAG TPA: hypothetical protein VGH77_17065 [Streptosporangiaceae bacterium]